jgi:hypothetical protein
MDTNTYQDFGASEWDWLALAQDDMNNPLLPNLIDPGLDWNDPFSYEIPFGHSSSLPCSSIFPENSDTIAPFPNQPFSSPEATTPSAQSNNSWNPSPSSEESPFAGSSTDSEALSLSPISLSFPMTSMALWPPLHPPQIIFGLGQQLESSVLQEDLVVPTIIMEGSQLLSTPAAISPSIQPNKKRNGRSALPM